MIIGIHSDFLFVLDFECPFRRTLHSTTFQMMCKICGLPAVSAGPYLAISNPSHRVPVELPSTRDTLHIPEAESQKFHHTIIHRSTVFHVKHFERKSRISRHQENPFGNFNPFPSLVLVPVGYSSRSIFRTPCESPRPTIPIPESIVVLSLLNFGFSLTSAPQAGFVKLSHELRILP